MRTPAEFFNPFEEIEEIENPESSDPGFTKDSLVKLGDLQDGGSVFEVDGEPLDAEETEKEPIPFGANLAETINEGTLNILAMRLIEDIKNDKEARSQWEKSINVAMKYLGLKIDETRKAQFIEACGAYDSTLLNALIRAYSVARAELFPAEGPAKCKINGVPTAQTEDEGERVKMFMNVSLTSIDRGYYPDSESLLLYTIFFGSGFRKVYIDPVLNWPIARYIKPQNFIVNPDTVDLLSSNRMTHVIYLDRKDIIIREQLGDFIDCKLPAVNDGNDDDDESVIENTIKGIEGRSTNNAENKNLFEFYESHVDLMDDELKMGSDDKSPKPYIVTICLNNRKIVAIRRNWKEEDRKYKRIECFVSWYYMKGFGIYGMGLAHFMGSNAIVMTNVLRQLIDAGTLKNFPGGLKSKTLRSENNDISVGPATWNEVETGGEPIANHVMLMPYTEPSVVLAGLLKDLKQDTFQLAGVLDEKIREMGPNAPVGTTLALLEEAGREQSTVLRSFNCSLGNELQLLFNTFGDFFQDNTPYPFKVPGKETAIMKSDFNDRINIVPVSDPNVLTSTHRLMRSQAILQLMQGNPQLYNARETNKIMLEAMNVENIDNILTPVPKPAGLDATSENIYLLEGMPIKVTIEQDDDSHLLIHTSFSNEQKPMNQAVYAKSVQHIQVHKASKIMKSFMQKIQLEIEKSMVMFGQPNPQLINQMMSMQELTKNDLNQLLNIPEIQNIISKKDAEEVVQMHQKALEDAANQPQSIDPNAVLLEDIKQHREASYLKHEIDKLRVELESFKAQLKYESEKSKMEADMDISSERNEVNLEIEQMKHSLPT